MLGFVRQPNLHWNYFLGLTTQYWKQIREKLLKNILFPALLTLLIRIVLADPQLL